jgi:hypothetical protein
VGVRIFAAQIDVAAGGTHGKRRDRHALDQAERVALHQQPIGKSARVAFIGVADDVFLRPRRVVHRLPLDAGGKSRAAAAAQTRIGDLLDDRAGSIGSALLKPS